METSQQDLEAFPIIVNDAIHEDVGTVHELVQVVVVGDIVESNHLLEDNGIVESFIGLLLVSDEWVVQVTPGNSVL